MELHRSNIDVVRILRTNAQSRPQIPEVAVAFGCATASREVDGGTSFLDEGVKEPHPSLGLVFRELCIRLYLPC